MYPHVADIAVSVRSGGRGDNQLDRQIIRQTGRTKVEWRKGLTTLANIVEGINIVDKQTRKSREGENERRKESNQ